MLDIEKGGEKGEETKSDNSSYEEDGGTAVRPDLKEPPLKD